MSEQTCHNKGCYQDASKDKHTYVVSVCSELIEIVRIGELIGHSGPPEIPDISYSVDKSGEYGHPCISHLHPDFLCIEKTEIQYNEQRYYKMEKESLAAIEPEITVMRSQDKCCYKESYGYGGGACQLQEYECIRELLLFAEP